MALGIMPTYIDLQPSFGGASLTACLKVSEMHLDMHPKSPHPGGSGHFMVPSGTLSGRISDCMSKGLRDALRHAPQKPSFWRPPAPYGAPMGVNGPIWAPFGSIWLHFGTIWTPFRPKVSCFAPAMAGRLLNKRSLLWVFLFFVAVRVHSSVLFLNEELSLVEVSMNLLQVVVKQKTCECC